MTQVLLFRISSVPDSGGWGTEGSHTDKCCTRSDMLVSTHSHLPELVTCVLGISGKMDIGDVFRGFTIPSYMEGKNPMMKAVVLPRK